MKHEPDSPPSAADIEHRKRLQQLSQQYQKKLFERTDQIKALWHKLCWYNWTDEAFHILLRLIHNLKGSAQVFGFSAVSKTAGDLETFIKEIGNTKQAPNMHQQTVIKELIDKLESAIQRPDRNTANVELDSKDNARSSQNLIYVVDDDAEVGQHVVEHLNLAGYQTRHFLNTADFFQALEQTLPSAVIMDIVFPEDSFAGIDTVAKIRASTAIRIPIFFLSARTDLTARLRAIRAGGDAYITKPADYKLLLSKLKELIPQRKSNAIRVLIIDDDKDLADYYQLVLQNQGMLVHTASDPMHAFEKIAEFKPNILLMDYRMPNVDGLELAKIIRQDPKLVSLPIIFVSAIMDETVRTQALGLGGNEFLAKPVDEQVLTQVIYACIRKAKKVKTQIKMVSRQDPSTGLVNRPAFMQLLEKTISNCSNASNPSSLLYITIDHFDLLKAQVGLIQLGELLKRLISRVIRITDAEDHVSQLSEGIITVLLSSSSEQDITRKAEPIRDAINKDPIQLGSEAFDVSCSIGIVQLNNSIIDIGDALSKAEQVANQANQSGGNQIVSFLNHSSTIKADDEISLLQAIKNKSFRMVFQPILGFGQNEDYSYEALIRVIDSQGRSILPERFYPVAEKNGLLELIDRWKIEQAIEILATHKSSRSPIKLFLKISEKAIADGSFLALLSNCLSASRLRGEQRIVLMVDMDNFSVHARSVANFVQLLHKLHCGLGMDQFTPSKKGKVLLEELQLDYIRFDAKPIKHPYSKDERNRLKSTISEIQKRFKPNIKSKTAENVLEMTSPDLNITASKKPTYKGPVIIAKSVEDPETMAMLWEWGVRNFQGYYIEEPRDALDVDFEELTQCYAMQ